VLFDNAKLLVRLLWTPAGGMGGILDRGSLLFASVAVLAVSLLLEFSLRPLMVPAPARVEQTAQAQEEAPSPPVAPARPVWSFSFYTPLLVLAVIYVPGMLVVVNLVARLGSLATVFERDYSSLLTCTAMAWAAVNLPLALIARVVPIAAVGAAAALAYLYFAVLMFFAVRTVFGAENRVAIGSVALSWIPLAAGIFVWGPLSFLLRWLASPFFLFYAFYYLRGEFSNLGRGLNQRQNFRRMLEAAAVNPHDGEAQYQLGLIYQQRRLYSEAIERFKNAVAIDATETDAHFQLGRIARAQGRIDDALAHFQTVLKQDEKHSLSEILRETGAAYLDAGRYQDARKILAEYVERRSYDSEGLFYYGQALERLGAMAEAREMYVRAIEAVRTAPRYRRRYTAKWSRLAEKQVKRLGPV
jgi:tetratricopeptide (TPR) repeat protein